MQNLFTGAPSAWVVIELLAAVLAALMAARSTRLAGSGLPILAITRRSGSATIFSKVASEPDGAGTDGNDGSKSQMRTRGRAPAGAGPDPASDRPSREPTSTRAFHDTSAADSEHSPVSGTDRPASGALRKLVYDYLVIHQGQDCSPTEIARALNRSRSAVGNALGRLVELGQAELTTPKPRRYALPTPTSNSKSKRRTRATAAKVPGAEQPAALTTTAEQNRKSATTSTDAEASASTIDIKASTSDRAIAPEADDAAINEQDSRQAITEALGAFHGEHARLLEQTSSSYDRRLDTLWNTAYQALMHDDIKAAKHALDQARNHAATLKGTKAPAKPATAAKGKDATTAS